MKPVRRQGRQLLTLFSLLLAAGDANGQAGLGSLRVQSQPGVEVIWESVSLGSTDESGELLVEQVPAGSYSVTLRRNGFRTASATIEITGGRTSYLLQRLERPVAEKAPAESPVQEAPTPKALESRPAAATPETPPSAAPELEAPAEVSAPSSTSADASPEIRELVASEATRQAGLNEPPGRSIPIPLLVLFLLAAASAIFYFRERRAPAAAGAASNGTIPEDPRPKAVPTSGNDPDPSFIHDLQRRERDLGDDRVAPPRPRRAEVIDVEFIEVEDADGGA